MLRSLATNYLSLLLVISGCIPVAGSSQNLRTNQIISKRILSVEDGLASREVFCAIQDDLGFMWFGTRNGLNRYDGKNTRLFTKERNGLAENRIIQLAKDNNNHLLIVYGSPGFARSVMRIEVMDLATFQIRSLEEAFPGLPFKGMNVYWVANGGGELCFLVANPFQYWRLTEKGFELKCEMKVWDRMQAADKRWLQANDNYHKSTGPECQFYGDCALLRVGTGLPGYFVTPGKAEMYTASDGLLIDSNRQLTNNWSQVYQQLNPHTSVKAQPSIAYTYLQGAIYFLSGDYSQSLVYRVKDGLFLYDFNSLYQLMAPEELKISSGYALYSYFIDRQKIIWICTSAGLLKIKQENNRFTHYFTKQQLRDSSDNQVRGIYADEEGQVYAAAWNRLWYNVRDKNISAKLGMNKIMYGVCRMGMDIYVGEQNIYLLDRKKKNKIQKLTDSTFTEIWSIDSLSPGKLLVGTTNAVFAYFLERKALSEVTYPNDAMPKAQFVYRFLRRKDKKLWVIAQNGLFLLDENASQVLDYFGSSSLVPAHKLPFDILLDAFEEETGTMWFATNGAGLWRWDRLENSFKQFKSTDGLPSDILYRIEGDKYNNLWISTDNGLMRINSKDFTSITFTTSSGISHNEFNRASSFKATDGRLFFGGLDGVNAFYPMDFSNDQSVSDLPVRIISYSKFSAEQDKLVDQTNALLAKNTISLSPGDRFFTLEFKLLDFEEGESSYAYMIRGVDKDWNYINENSVRISGLPYGRNTLLVKGQTHKGQWSKAELQIPLNVLKPYYLQWWFIISVAILSIVAIVLLYKRHVRKLVNSKLKLEKEILIRTKDLEDSLAQEQALLQEKDVLLKEVHHRVKNNLQVISGLLELQEKTVSDGHAKLALQQGRTRVRSIALIHQNLYQYENLSCLEVKSFVNDLYQQVSSMYERAAMVTTANIKIPLLEIDIDTAVPFGLALNELLTNSFKYGYEPGKLFEINMSLVSEKLEDDKGNKFIFDYKDSGPGLPAEFELARSKSLGMRLVNDLSKQMGGRLLYSFDNGSHFTIIFYDKKARKQND